ncbi:hypothetical protein MOPEL_023_00270 [Mobilicoccus pelagius NBRC 104925]|uniref:Uncharacterized protein n=1 Tax=Mobilicoccus pelagius NBRC 104925 TaxID=1089455 RepID=H5UPM9_9MICO|nr:hypothetical protein MOPEL_023_00270 [Mobilicoccus pelagius NBRC 104925]
MTAGLDDIADQVGQDLYVRASKDRRTGWRQPDRPCLFRVMGYQVLPVVGRCGTRWPSASRSPATPGRDGALGARVPPPRRAQLWLRAPMGVVEHTPSRETLSHTEKTVR